VGMVSYEVYTYLQVKGGNIANITFMDWDPNPWDIIQTGLIYIIFSTLMALLFLTNSIFAGYRIVKWLYTMKQDFKWNIGLMCLTLEWICNILRVLQIVLICLHNNFRLPGTETLYTLPLCFTLITSIVVVFFWLDLTSDPFYNGKFLGAMKIPAIIFITLFLLTELILDICRAYTDIDFLSSILGFYFVFHSIVTIFNFIASYRILSALKEQKEGKKKLKRIILRIIYSGITTMMGVFLYILFLSPLMNTPVPYIILFGLIYFTFFLQSLLLITIFRVPKRKDSKSFKTDMSSTKETGKTDIDTE